MRPTHAFSRGVVALAAATALAASALAGPAGAGSSTSSAPTARNGDGPASYLVLATTARGADAVAARLRAQGATVTSVNSNVGVVNVRSDDADFRESASAVPGVQGVAGDRAIGEVPQDPPASGGGPEKDAVEEENAAALATGQKPSTLSAPGKRPAKVRATADPLDNQLWGMQMIRADLAHDKTLGKSLVRVGVIDTGVDGSHPDLQSNFDTARSRNFTTDIPTDELGQEVDGPCEFRGCVDPANWDDQGHGTHVAGTIAAAANGLGVSGVAPKVRIVNVRAGQDSGFFFLQPVIDALTYAGTARLNVVNMSFYVDPWLFNCQANPADSPEEQAEQRTIVAAVSRALNFAHHQGVTLVGAAGNGHLDLANPIPDVSSPDYPFGTAHTRTIDNSTCASMPVEGPRVLGVTALGPSGSKADFSNYTSAPSSGEVELSAPGGWFRDYFGTDKFRTNENQILSTAPRNVMLAKGYVDADGNLTPDGVALGVQKVCPASPAGAACGYYQFLQGTSMASPHVAGVAALAISRHGRKSRNAIAMNPDAVRRLLLRTAMNRSCPVPPTVDYLDEGRTEEFTATCVGTTARNGFYGEGIANAWGVVR